MRKMASVFILGAMVSLLFGCAGPKFSAVASVPPNKAVVYIYRKAALGGVLGNHHIFVNGKPVASLYSGSYYPYLADPGTNCLSSKMVSLAIAINMTMNAQFKHQVCCLNVEPGKTYYVQFEIATTWGPKMTEVNADTGSRDIQDCELAKALK
jgi:hypothetical protein